MKKFLQKITSVFKSGKLKNQFLLKRGGFALITTVLLIAAIIVINAVAMPVLSERFHLNYDFSKDKIASLSKENIKFIKEFKDPVTITVTCPEDQYATCMQNYTYTMNYYSAAVTDTSSFEQTVTLLKKYHEYNKKITVKFADESEAMKLAQQYQNSGLETLGDIIIQADDRSDRFEILNYDDIYTDNCSEYLQGSATDCSVTENKIETALSGAMYDVTADVSGGEAKKKTVIYTRGDTDLSQFAEELTTFLNDNRYEVETVDTFPIKEIADDVDMAVLMPSQVDLLESEEKVLSDYLDNAGKLGKNFMYFALAQFDYSKLPNLTTFLGKWGVKPENGMMFDFSGQYSQASESSIISVACDNYENPKKTYLSAMDEAFTVDISKLEDVTEVLKLETAPVMYAYPYDGGEEVADEEIAANSKAYPFAVQLRKSVTDDSGVETGASTFTVFSSCYFAAPDTFSAYGASNRELLTEYFVTAMGDSNTATMDFGAKNITVENFLAEDKAISNMKTIFIWIIPLLTLAAGIVVYVWRRKSK